MNLSRLIQFAVLGLVGCAGVNGLDQRNDPWSSLLATAPKATTERDILRAIEGEPLYHEFRARVSELSTRPGRSIIMVKDFHHNRTYGALGLFTTSNRSDIIFVPVHQFGTRDVHVEHLTIPLGAESEVWQFLDEMKWTNLPPFSTLRIADETSSAPLYLAIQVGDTHRHHVVSYGNHDAMYAELLRRLGSVVPDNRFWGRYKVLKPLPVDRLNADNDD